MKKIELEEMKTLADVAPAYVGTVKEIEYHVARARLMRSMEVTRIAKAVFGSIFNGVKAAFETFKAYRVRRAAMVELISLDDRMLADLGLSRCDVRAAVAGMTIQRDSALANDNLPAAANGNAHREAV